MRISSEARVLRPGAVFTLYRDVWRQLTGQRHVFVGAVLLLISAQVVLLSVPYISGRALNALQLHGTAGFRDAALWLSMVLLVACGSWVLHGPGRILERRGALLIRQRMSALLVDRLFELPLSWHEVHHSGATAHRVQQSTQALSSFAQSQFIYLNSAVRLLGPLVALWWIQPAVGIVAVVGFALIICSVMGFDRAMLRLANQENDAERHYSAALIDTLGNTGTVYALRQARGVAARLQRRLLAVFVPLRRAIVLNELKWCTVDLSTRVLTCCLVGLFVSLATRADSGGAAGKTLLLGSLYMVWEYAQQAAGVISSIASHFQTFARQHADYASADLIRSSVPNPPAPGSIPSTAQWRRLTIRDLTFRHGSARDRSPALDRLAFCLERGKRYALIGASGSGKSTLMRVLAGLYAAERIALKLDEGATHVSPAETSHMLRACSTLIPQDAEVYEGTLGRESGALRVRSRSAPARRIFSGARHSVRRRFRRFDSAGAGNPGGGASRQLVRRPAQPHRFVARCPGCPWKQSRPAGRADREPRSGDRGTRVYELVRRLRRRVRDLFRTPSEPSRSIRSSLDHAGGPDRGAGIGRRACVDLPGVSAPHQLAEPPGRHGCRFARDMRASRNGYRPP